MELISYCYLRALVLLALAYRYHSQIIQSNATALNFTSVPGSESNTALQKRSINGSTVSSPSIPIPPTNATDDLEGEPGITDAVTHTCGARDPITGEVRSLRIMTSSTDEYFPVFMNWLAYYHRICPSVANLYFICLDMVIEKKLANYGLSCAHVYHVTATGVHDIWLVRTRLTHTLLSQGHDVLLTDSDALWLKNPFPYIESYLKSDIISSRGSFPDAIGKSLGATLCMGFVYVKASPHTTVLWGEIAALMARQPNPDDQRDINTFFQTLGLHYSSHLTYIGSTDFSTGHFQHKNHNYAVTLLPHTLFRRICDQEKKGETKSAVVAHCLSHQKKGSSKISTAEALGMWLLRRDWERVKLHGDLQAYLDEITEPTASSGIVSGRGRAVRGLLRGYAAVNCTTSTTVHQEHNSSSLVSQFSSGAGAAAAPCMEFHSNRRIFLSHAARTAQTCWYVSPSAPEEAVRQFEEMISKGSVAW